MLGMHLARLFWMWKTRIPFLEVTFLAIAWSIAGGLIEYSFQRTIKKIASCILHDV